MSEPTPDDADEWLALSYLLRVAAHYAGKAGDKHNRTQRVLGAREVRTLTPDLTQRLRRVGALGRPASDDA